MNNSEPSDCDIEIGTAMRLLNNLCNANSSFAQAVPHKPSFVDEVANYLCVRVFLRKVARILFGKHDNNNKIAFRGPFQP